MKFGFGKVDITPRLGVELYGYSGYLNRYAKAIRDPLWVRAMAVSDGRQTLVLASCDLVFVTQAITDEVRRRVGEKFPLPTEAIMVHATHTHSGPCVRTEYRNAYDPAWNELLPRRIATACLQALADLRESEIRHAAVPCHGLGRNRVHDTPEGNPLDESWRPLKPELTDTTCHVFTVVEGPKLRGFISSIGCHPVVGGAGSTYLHGDFPGLACAAIEREHPGSVGMFLIGAAGDINVSANCYPDDGVLEVLDIISARYARSVREGIRSAKPLAGDTIDAAILPACFSRRRVSMEELRERLAVEEEVIGSPDASDADQRLRWAVLRARALRDLIQRMERGDDMENPVSVHGFRVGEAVFLTAPLEIFNAIRKEVVETSKHRVSLVLGLTNDEQGYAPDQIATANPSDYAAQVVPLWKHSLPYANIHRELADVLLALDQRLAKS